MNKILNKDCLELLKDLEDNYIDITVTSPPYDNLRGYDALPIDKFKLLADELYRTTKDGGVVVWSVGDAVVNGSETLTSFKQALYFNEIGFNLHDTMLYEKNSSTFPSRAEGNRYTQIFEYMFVFSKGKPKTANLICDKKNKWAGSTDFSGKQGKVPDYSPRNNIWRYITSFDDKNEHPAIMPLQMAIDHINTWSKEGDLVFDPFMGSGTTAKAAIERKRNYLGSEINEDYYNICIKRIKSVQQGLF